MTSGSLFIFLEILYQNNGAYSTNYKNSKLTYKELKF